MRRTTLTAATAAVALLAGGAALAPSATAQTVPTSPKPLAAGLFSPLSAAVDGDGTAYVTQNFAGSLLKVRPGRSPRQVFALDDGSEVGGVSVRNGVATFAVTGPTQTVRRIDAEGRVRTLADVGRYEQRRNPDAGVTYGLRHVTEECAAQFPADGIPARYTGIVESHPYATATAGRLTYLADAASNDVLAIGPRGAMRTVAVLPPVAARLTAPVAAAMNMPDCAVGQTYHFEAVPTDVEVGPDGRLYVSTLPGGPEDGSAGALARVYRIDPRTGRIATVAKGLVSAVNVAVAPNRDVYVAELFTNRIARVKHGTTTVRTFKRATMPGAVEWTPRGVHATVNVMSGLSGNPGDAPAGRLVRFLP